MASESQDLENRDHWRSKIGFILAAAGSAVGLGNVWKFPYITGENGGGYFVLIYLVCIALIGLPIMIAEVLVGRATQRSPVGAFRDLSQPASAWISVGWLGVATAFVILSYYSVVAGWALHYTWLSVSGALFRMPAEQIESLFGEVYGSSAINVGWHLAFMGMTVGVVLGGVRKGIERWSRILMPMLFAALIGLAIYSSTLPGFARAVDFVFGGHAEKITAASVLEALGHSFFTLSLGMGAMLTYGSYFSRRGDIVGASTAIAVLDTAVALLACLVLFPITFSYGMAPAAGPGLVFKSIPLALAQVPGGTLLAGIFFGLLVFAALTSAISLLEVAAAYFIDERGWSRRQAVLTTGAVIACFGLPSALSGNTSLFGEQFAAVLGRNWFDTFDHLASNWMLPMGGLGISLFTAWRVGDAVRRDEFLAGSRLGRLYAGWVLLLRYVVPVCVIAVFLHALGLI